MDKTVIQYRMKWAGRRIKRKITKKKLEYQTYAGRELMTLQEANDWIKAKIESGEPLMCARFGSIELEASWCYEESAGVSKKKKAALLDKMKNNAGFFPKEDGCMKRFSLLMKESTRKADLLAVWFNPMEDYMVEKYSFDCSLCHLRGLEPYYVENPWTKSLKGKKVVVVHPFAKTIRKQYKKRTLLFKNEEILPEFEILYTIQAVQTAGKELDKRFQNWFEALEWMYQETMKLDFDVAIIGCGAYGFPLAAKIKESGKQAIHMGGATQILFGIKGRRWDSHPIIKHLYNEYWVRPDESERPEGAESIEQGCYW